MNAGILLLGLAYVLSQFFRAFLAVLAPVLSVDIGTTPDDLAFASGMWFLAFAAMQIPVGWALDTIGPRRTAAWLLLIGGGGGAAIFAMATTAAHLNIAMALIGVGCAPVLMASYYIFAREYPPAQFAVLASVMVGLGSVGNLVASYPMALAADTMGWRPALWGLGAVSVLVALGTLMLVQDPKPVEGEKSGSLLELLRLRVLWPIYPIIFFSYAISGALRGLWIGPYLADYFTASTGQIGTATLLMGLAMIAGTLAYGPADRLLPSRKWMIAGGTLITLICAYLLVINHRTSFELSVALMCGIGFFGATYPVLMAHGRSFLPSHLIGRGVTMLNLCSIGGVGVLQFTSGRVYNAAVTGKSEPWAFAIVFAMFASCVLVGLVIYMFSRDSTRT
jgi:MFS family permease